MVTKGFKSKYSSESNRAFCKLIFEDARRIFKILKSLGLLPYLFTNQS